MDRQLAERMVGAACLLAVLVLVVPAILDGNPDSGSSITHPSVREELDLRTHTIRLDGAEREPPVPTPLKAEVAPEPAGPPAAPDAGVPAEAPAGALAGPGDRGVAQEIPASAEPALPPPPPPVAGAAETRAKPPTGRGGDWFVQLGSFSSRANADRLAGDVKARGFSVSVQGGGGSSGTLFRVRAGPEPDKAGAEALSARLAAAGFEGGRVGRN
jgi:DedD protein